MRRFVLIVLLVVQACARAPSLDSIEASGITSLQAGNLAGAEASAQEGLRRAEVLHDDAWKRRFRTLAAEVLVEQRRNPEALSLLATEPPSATDTDRITIRILTARGRARCLSARNPDAIRTAEADLQRAATGAATLAAPSLAAEAARDRGICASQRADFATAEMRYREALDLAHRHGLSVLEGKATGSLGIIRVQTRHYDDAIVWLNKALVLATDTKSDLVAVKTLTNLGWCHYALGDYPQALTFLSKSDALAQSRGYKGEREVALEMMGNVHYRLRDFDQAASAYRRALTIATELADRKLMAELSGNLGYVQFEQGRYDEADASVTESLRIKTEMEDEPARQHSLLARGNIAEGRGDYAKADALYRQVLAAPGVEPELQWETRASLATVRMKTGRFVEADQEFRNAFGLIDQSRSEIRRPDHKISFFSSLYRFYDSYVDFLVARGETARALEVADRSRARLLRETDPEASARTASSAEFRQVARALDATLLFYWLAPGRSFLWTITERDVHLHVLPAADEIGKHVDAYQSIVLRSRDPLKEAAPDAEWLYRTLIEPARSSVASGSRVVFIPDGALHQINPETLIVASPSPHYWIEDVTLLVAPSVPMLTAGTDRSRQAQSQPPSILLIGDPTASGAEFPRLQYASREVSRIGDQFPASERTIRSGADANPKAYLTSTPARFSFVHFAAHAEANAEAPLESAVILSAGGDSPKLYARDILGVPLQADLVTISGCRSAGSRTYSGEGLVGLAWAFMSAGAHRVIAGVWNVEDASTSELMEQLYRGLTHGERPEDALRHAKLQLIRSDGAYRKPYYWAPFMTYTRSARPLAGRTS